MEPRDDGTVRPVGGPVDVLVGVDVVVVQLDVAARVYLAGQAVRRRQVLVGHPLGVAVALRAHAVAHIHVRADVHARELRERRRLPAARGRAHQRHERHALGARAHGRRVSGAERHWRQARGVGERREQVDELRQPIGDDAAVGLARHAHHHGRVRRQLEVGVFAPLAVLAQLPAVVAPEADDRVVGEPQLVECRHDAADERVDVRYRRVVGPAQLEHLRRRQGRVDGAVAVLVLHVDIAAQLVEVRPRDLGQIDRRVRVVGKAYFRFRVVLEKSSGEEERQVGTMESDGDEEGPLGRPGSGRQSLQRGDGVVGGDVVQQRMFLHLAFVGRVPAVAGVLAPVLAVRVEVLLRPRHRVVVTGRHARMEDLTHADRRVAMLLEVLRYRREVAADAPEVGDEVVHVRRVGPPSGEQRRATGRADGLLDVRAPQEQTATRQSVEVGRVHLRRDT